MKNKINVHALKSNISILLCLILGQSINAMENFRLAYERWVLEDRLIFTGEILKNSLNENSQYAPQASSSTIAVNEDDEDSKPESDILGISGNCYSCQIQLTNYVATTSCCEKKLCHNCNNKDNQLEICSACNAKKVKQEILECFSCSCQITTWDSKTKCCKKRCCRDCWNEMAVYKLTACPFCDKEG